MIPPGRGSSSQSTTSAPCGPNQRSKCSAFVQTSKTSERGASNTRWMTSSPAEMSLSLLLRAGIPLLLSGRFPALRLELAQVHVESIEALLPEAAVFGGPLRDLSQRGRVQLARAPLRLPGAGDETGALEDPEMLRDGRAADRERSRELRDGGGSPGEPRQDRSPGGVGERSEGRAQAVFRFHLTHMLSNRLVLC